MPTERAESATNLKKRREIKRSEKPLEHEDHNIPPRELDIDEPKIWQICFAYFVLSTSVLCLVIVYSKLPQLLEGDSLSNYLKIPRTVGDAKAIGNLILKYKDDHYYSVFGAYFATYILLQSLCIPGTLVLSVLAGYLFPFPLALLIISVCSTLGASTFYIVIYRHKRHLTRLLSRGDDSWLARYNDYIQEKIKNNRSNSSNLFLCVFLLRATPIFPNWTINLCSPIVNLPLKPFVWGTFFGVVPLSLIHVCTGRILNDLSSESSLFSTKSVLMSCMLIFALFIIAYLKRFADQRNAN